jgi:glycosyltransferase involved in cell wall biosynthesis
MDGRSDGMVPPFLSYITYNRLGLTIQSLTKLLSSSEDFELHIIDSNSKDDTWDYLMSLGDSRIKSRTRFEINHGKIYALNMNLLTRSPEQYFFSVDCDAVIETDNWISKFMGVFEAFPDVGLLGVPAKNESLPPVLPQTNGIQTYLELSDNRLDVDRNYIPGYCMGLRPELIKELGYFCEENYFGEMELCHRVCNYTNWKAGFLPDVNVTLPQKINCSDCLYADKCTMNKENGSCFQKYEQKYKNEEFLKKYRWKFEETMKDMQSGARPAYCASLLDGNSSKEHIYNTDWAMENFYFFINNAN